jgi:hypothetical protein
LSATFANNEIGEERNLLPRLPRHSRESMKAKLLPLSILFVSSALADDSTWSSNPLTDDWNTATNWVPNQASYEGGDGNDLTLTVVPSIRPKPTS